MINEYYESYYRNLEDNSNLRDLKERSLLLPLADSIVK